MCVCVNIRGEHCHFNYTFVFYVCAKANTNHNGTKAILACVYCVHNMRVGRENEIFLIVNVVEVELKAIVTDTLWSTINFT